ncbi:MAG TPA: hypothetical protein PLF11_04965 [Bacillota bacterium]|nr:hypothetical protein [Bacillota bacterium]
MFDYFDTDIVEWNFLKVELMNELDELLELMDKLISHGREENVEMLNLLANPPDALNRSSPSEK